MNSAFLKEADVKAKIHEIWTKQASLPFYGKLRRCIKFYKEYCIAMAKARKENDVLLRQQMEKATVVLQAWSDDQAAQAEVARVEQQLKGLDKWKLEGQRLRSRLKWKNRGDECSQEFFQAHSATSATSQITKLEDKSGVTRTSQRELGSICQLYYKLLYQARPPTSESTAAEDTALGYMNDRIPESMKNSLRAPITATELKTAVMAMRTRRAPGPDGITLEFFQCYW